MNIDDMEVLTNVTYFYDPMKDFKFWWLKCIKIVWFYNQLVFLDGFTSLIFKHN